MKHFRILLVALGILQAVGLLVILMFGALRADATEKIEIASGDDSFGHLEVDTLGGGTISGRFTTDSGNPVLFMVLDDDQYADFAAGRSCGTLFSAVGSSAEFNVGRPGMERGHIVAMHAGDPDPPESVSVSYTVNSIDWEAFALGTVLVFGAALISGILMLKHSRDKKREKVPMTPYIDVVIFDEKQEE